MALSILLVDDHAILREGLRALLEKDPALIVAGEAGNGAEAVRLAAGLQPDLVIMDLTMPVMSGIEATREIIKNHPRMKVLALSMENDRAFVVEALKAGASGYLLKPVRKEELVQAIRDVVAGGSPITSSIARKVVVSFHRQPATPADEEMNSLSERELAVLEMLAQGLIYKEIAEKLGISLWTVSTYVQRAYKKLHVTGRAEALAKLRKESGR